MKKILLALSVAAFMAAPVFGGSPADCKSAIKATKAPAKAYRTAVRNTRKACKKSVTDSKCVSAVADKNAKFSALSAANNSSTTACSGSTPTPE